MKKVRLVAARGISYERVFGELEERLNILLSQFEEDHEAVFEKIEYSTMAYPAGNNGITEFVLSALVQYSVPNAQQ